jgi:hypothetical protein
MKFTHSIPLAGLALLVSASSFADEPFTVTELCSTSVNSVGAGVSLALEGVQDLHPDRALLTGGPSGKFGALIYGSVATSEPIPWGNGSLCISPFHPSNGRYTVGAFSAGGAVDFDMASDTPGGFPFSPGESGCFQYLYRDDVGWNLSNALMVAMAP